MKLAAADYGFQLERKYEAIDNPADVQREADGTWVIKAGARVRGHVTMSNQAPRYHVAPVDPLPAGLEPLNPELVTTEQLPQESREEAINRGGSGIYDLLSLMDRQECLSYFTREKGTNDEGAFEHSKAPSLF